MNPVVSEDIQRTNFMLSVNNMSHHFPHIPYVEDPTHCALEILRGFQVCVQCTESHITTYSDGLCSVTESVAVYPVVPRDFHVKKQGASYEITFPGFAFSPYLKLVLRHEEGHWLCTYQTQAGAKRRFVIYPTHTSYVMQEGFVSSYADILVADIDMDFGPAIAQMAACAGTADEIPILLGRDADTQRLKQISGSPWYWIPKPLTGYRGYYPALIAAYQRFDIPYMATDEGLKVLV